MDGDNVFESGNEGNVPVGNNQQQTPNEFEYVANGMTIREPIDTILKRASMGYDYAQKMDTLKSEMESLSQREQQLSSIEQKWKPYEDYARQNPSWEQHVRSSWERRGQQFGEETYQNNQQTNALPPEISQKLQKFDSFMEHYQRAEEDAMLNQEVNAVKQKHPDIDFASTDPTSGKSLEYKVLEHAKTHGIRSFRAAFYDFYHPQLIRQAEEKAKQSLGANIQNQSRDGLIDQGIESYFDRPAPKHLKDMSWDQVMSAAKQDLGIN